MPASSPESPLTLDSGPLSIADVGRVARAGASVEIGAGARDGIDAAHRIVAARAAGDAPFYGINTGFGSFSHFRIAPDQLREIQHNLIRSHAAGVGTLLPEDTVRAMLLVLAASLCRGRSGVRIELVEQIVALLNRNITPIVPSRGSVGASGDLAPLSHLALVLIGEGEAWIDGERRSGADALAAADLVPVRLEAKEGLALVNGTHLMTATAALCLHDTRRLVDAALCATGLAIDACRATDAFLDARVHEARRQPGQIAVAAALRDLLAGTEIVPAHREEDPRVQDPYGLRAAPQVLGAVIDAIDHVRAVIERELGAVTDNPLVFPESTDGEPDIVSAANFHGMPVAIALDTLAVALTHLAGIAERRIYWLLKASDSENPVNAFLSPQPGRHSGLMITQYTAAACCNELQTLAFPASVANISTAAGIEDYNSMGATSAHQARAAVDLATSVIAIELLVMAEAMEYQRPLRSGAGVERAYERVRSVVPRLSEDRPPAPDIEAIATLIREGVFSPAHA